MAYHEFDPYGNPVADEGDPYGYTGEWWEDAVGLLHLRARWYLPETGTFLSVDPVESEPPYQYVRGNVINWVDPSGQCPAPPSGSGNIICFAGFIPTEFSRTPFSDLPSSIALTFLGDNRDFSKNSPKDRSRFWVWIDVASGNVVNPGGQPYVHPTCTANGECDEPFGNWANNFDIRLSNNGEITIRYRALLAHWTGYVSPGPHGFVGFRPNKCGGYDSKGAVEQFPNLEAYYYVDGQYHSTILQRQYFSEQERESGIADESTAFGMFGFNQDRWAYPGESAPASCNAYWGCLNPIDLPSAITTAQTGGLYDAYLLEP